MPLPFKQERGSYRDFSQSLKSENFKIESVRGKIISTSFNILKFIYLTFAVRMQQSVSVTRLFAVKCLRCWSADPLFHLWNWWCLVNFAALPPSAPSPSQDALNGFWMAPAAPVPPTPPAPPPPPAPEGRCDWLEFLSY